MSLTRRESLSLLVLAGAGVALAGLMRSFMHRPRHRPEMSESFITLIPADTEKTLLTPLPQSEEEWQEILTPEQYRVLRQAGTERAFTGIYWNSKQPGIYHCAGCGLSLFHSDHKYDSGTGWPSFWQPIHETHVVTQPDDSLFMRRTEVLCSRCGGHLGHVFHDGPQPTGLRYCMNSAALRLEAEEPSAETP